jgi:hypothetical protein
MFLHTVLLFSPLFLLLTFLEIYWQCLVHAFANMLPQREEMLVDSALLSL